MKHGRGIGLCFTALTLAFFGATVFAGWESEIVDSSASYGMTQIAVDSNGYPHLTYNGTTVWTYAYLDGGGWTIETVDIEGLDASMVLDVNDYAHVSYSVWTGSDYDLKYAYQDSGGWHIVTVRSGIFIGWTTAMDLDQDGYPHISYSEYDTENLLRHTWEDISGWHTETAATSAQGIIEGFTDIAVDTGNYAHIIYVPTAGNHFIYHAYQDSGGWQTETVNGEQSLLFCVDTDSGNYPHIVFQSEVTGLLHYSFKSGTGWTTETAASDSGMYCSLVLDDSGMPHISYAGDSSNIKYAYQDGRAWVTEEIDAGTMLGRDNAIALDVEGKPHVSYCDEFSSDVKYAVRETDDVPATGPIGLGILVIAFGVIMTRFRVASQRRSSSSD
jgi:hypothetical protein